MDAQARFAGLIPPDRVLAVLLAEHAEDLSRLGGFIRSTASIRTTAEEAVPRRFRHRLPWLLVGLAGALLSADIVAAFEAQLQGMVMIAFFIPAIVYLADAVGTQTETIVVRGLSIGVRFRQMLFHFRYQVVTPRGILVARYKFLHHTAFSNTRTYDRACGRKHFKSFDIQFPEKRAHSRSVWTRPAR